MIKRIDTLKIENIKGISQATFKLDLLPNKPTIVVAPNGFGKSSIATAFSSLNSKRIELSKDHLHKGDESLSPLVELSVTNKDGSCDLFRADSQSNSISSVFSVYVISSQLVPKAKRLRIGGAPVVTAAIEVQPIVLIAKVPKKISLNYSLKNAKATFGAGGTALPSISPLLGDPRVMARIGDDVDFTKIGQVGISKAVSEFKDLVNGKGGVAPKRCQDISAAELASVSDLSHFKQIIGAAAASGYSFVDSTRAVLAAIQMTELYAQDKSAFSGAVKRAQYEVEKDAYIRTLKSLRPTWKKIEPRESANGLAIEFPKANFISNGERDAICFVAQLLRAKMKLRGSNAILLIDEIFDYLDEANMVACQYYLSNLISAMKADGKQIFPIVLTHLDPNYFRNFTFARQKVCYLSRFNVTDRQVERVIVKREDPLISSQVSEFFLHFNPSDIDLSPQFQALGLSSSIDTAAKFSAHCLSELSKYLSGKNYDPIAVCCAVRLKVEEAAYNAIDPPHRLDFLKVHKTVEKLQFATSRGYVASDIQSLLGLIYNSAMHLRDGADNHSPLANRLENMTIRQMISVL